MADQVTVTNLPDSGSRERVAFDLFRYTQSHLPDGKAGLARIEQLLGLYAQCLNATHGAKVDLAKIT